MMPTTTHWLTVSRLLSAAVLLTCMGILGAEVPSPPPDEKTVAEEIHDISFLMQCVANRLRDDDSSQPVQLDSKEVIERMEKLIKDAEECETHPLKVGRKPAPDSELTPHKPSNNPKENTIYDDGTGNVWAKLPRSQRGEMIQVYAREFPLIWRLRISAYLLSINAAETSAKKK